MFTNNLKSRGYLPHFDRTGQVHTVRISEADVVPPSLRDATTLSPYGTCRLAIPKIADIVVESLKFQESRGHLDLFAYVIMPNHVHLLARFHEPLHSVIGGMKSFTSQVANHLLGRTGVFWQRDYFDQLVWDDDEFRMAKSYIEYNPVRAGLCGTVADWRYSSAWKPIET